jgi:DNA polymerase elongation subunit (family B)
LNCSEAENNTRATPMIRIFDKMVLIYTQTYKVYKNKLFMFGLIPSATSNSNEETERVGAPLPVTALITDWITVLDVKIQTSEKNRNPIMLQGCINVEKSRLASIISKYSRCELVSHGIVELYDFHSFQVNRNKFHRLKIKINDYSQYIKLVKDIKKEMFEVAETLHETEQFLLDYNLKPTQWLEISGEVPLSNSDFIINTNGSNSRNASYLQVNASNMKSLDERNVSVKIPSSLVGTFDIETYSSKWKERRMPDSTVNKDVIYAISYALSYSDSNVPLYKKCIAILDETRRPLNSSNDTIWVDDEEELLNTFARMVIDTDPDIMTGYNIFGFDFQYISKRSLRYGGLKNIGRIRARSFSNDRSSSEGRTNEDEFETFESKKWTGAGGHYHEYHYPLCIGRIILDTNIRTFKMPVDFTSNGIKGVDSAPKSHSLDNVGKFLVGETKKEITCSEGITNPYIEQFKRHYEATTIDSNVNEEQMAKYIEVIEYCIQDTVLCMKVFHELKLWVEIRESASILFQDPNDLLVTGQTRKYKAQLFRATKELGYFIMPPKQTSSFKLKGGFVQEPLSGFQNDVVVVDFASMYPSIMMRWNICPSVFKQSLCNVPVEFHKDFEEITIPIERGLSELPGDYEIPEDFDMNTFIITHSGAPISSSMKKNKYDINDIKGYNKDYVIDTMNQEDYDIALLESYVNMICEINGIPKFHKGKEEHLEMYLYQKREGVIPTILSRLKTERSNLKKLKDEAKDSGDSVLESIYDQRQNAIKVLMNSIYGIYGSQEGNFGFMEGSAAVTYYGRTLIQTVNNFLISKNCEIVYGDTDSSFFRILPLSDVCSASTRHPHETTLNNELPVKNTQMTREETVARAIELVNQINTIVLSGATQIELEKIMAVICLAKKKYIGYIWYDGSKHKILPVPKQIIRGVAPVRGDTLPFTKTIYRKVIIMLFRDASSFVKNEEVPSTNASDMEQIRNDAKRNAIKEFYETEMNKLKNGNVDRSLLILSKTLNQTYNSPSAPMNVYGRYLTEKGEIAQPGTKLSFVIVKGEGSVGSRYRPIDTKESIDYDYYHRLATTPLEQILKASNIL